MSEVTFVVYSEDRASADVLSGLIEATTHGRLLGTAGDELELRKLVEEFAPHALLVVLGESRHESLDAVEGVHRQVSALYVCGPQDDSSLVLRALKFGAKEYFPAVPELADLEIAVQFQVAAAAPREDPDPPFRGSRTIAVLGAKGGVGATFVACELAAKLQRMSGRAGIVDLSTTLGDVAVHFDLRPQHTLAGLLNQPEGCDVTYVRKLLAPHRSGLKVLAAPEQVEDTQLVTATHVEQVLGHLRGELDWVVVDVSRSWNDASVRALDLADEIVLVTSSDVAALAHARQHLDLLTRLGHGESKVHVVANRRSWADAVTESDFTKFLDRPIDVSLPNDYPTAVEASNGGKNLDEVARNSKLNRAFEKLACEAYLWCDVPVPDPHSGSANTLGGRVRRVFRR
jgi:pilus assembly protein CpaE